MRNILSGRGILYVDMRHEKNPECSEENTTFYLVYDDGIYLYLVFYGGNHKNRS